MSAGMVWIGASHVFGRPVPVDGQYPHICKMPLISRTTGQQVFERVGDSDKFRPVTLWRRDCAACADDKARDAAAKASTGKTVEEATDA
jgi:hypothetical protein